MGTLTVGTNSYNVYDGVDLPAAKAYIAAAIGAGPSAWNALATDDLKSAPLVQAFRMLEVMLWQGTKTSPTQPMQWPRTGVVDSYGNPVAVNATPAAIVQGVFELAAAIAADPTIPTQVQSGSNVHRVDAKGVAVQFFRPTNVPGVSPLLPVQVQRLVAPFFASAASAPLSRSFQSNDPNSSSIDSAFSDGAIMDRVGPLI